MIFGQCFVEVDLFLFDNTYMQRTCWCHGKGIYCGLIGWFLFRY